MFRKFRNLGKKLQPNELFLTILKTSISGTVRTFTRTRGTCIGGNRGQLTEHIYNVSDNDNYPYSLYEKCGTETINAFNTEVLGNYILVSERVCRV